MKKKIILCIIEAGSMGEGLRVCVCGCGYGYVFERMLKSQHLRM